jgi:hypothetical protein
LCFVERSPIRFGARRAHLTFGLFFFFLFGRTSPLMYGAFKKTFV